jgi:DNA polymerase-3 subunit beta
MECKNDLVTLTGFDLSLGIKTQFKADIEDEGTITIPAKLFGDIVAKLPDEDVFISCEDADEFENPYVNIKSKSGKFQLRGVPSTEYPDLPKLDDEVDYSLPSKCLREGLSNTIFASATDETKQILTGVHISQNVDRLEFASTDGHRLAVVKTFSEEDESFEDEFKLTVPSKTLKEVEKIIGDNEAVSMMASDSLIVFSAGNTTIVSRSLDGSYPNYPQLIPTNFEKTLVVNRKALIDSLEQVSVFTDLKNNMIKFSLAPDEDLVISVEAKELGNAKSSLSVEVTGEAMMIGFNLKYLMEGLRTMNSTDVKFQFNGATQPVIITPLSGLNMTYLIMPVQIKE